MEGLYDALARRFGPFRAGPRPALPPAAQRLRGLVEVAACIRTLTRPGSPSGTVWHMRLLFVKEALAWPRSSGHDVHCFHMMQALAALGHEVSLATVKPAAEEAVAGLPLRDLLCIGTGEACGRRACAPSAQTGCRSVSARTGESTQPASVRSRPPRGPARPTPWSWSA